jgi:hypothetical protein
MTAAPSSPAAGVLARLLAATPPPPPDADLDELLAAFAALHAEREHLLTQIAAPLVLSTAEREVTDAIAARQAAWSAALTAAHARLCEQRLGVARLRAYAATAAAALDAPAEPPADPSGP